MGFWLIRGTVRVLPVAHGDVAAGSVLIAVLILIGRTPTSGDLSVATSVGLVALVLTIAVAASLLVGTLLTRGQATPLLRPGRDSDSRGASFVVGSLAAGLALRSVLAGTLTERDFVVPDPLRLDRIQDGRWALPGGLSVPVRAVFVLIVALAVGIAVQRLVIGSRAGLAMRAMADDHAAATLCGVSSRKAVTTAFLLAGLLAGVAALLWTPQRTLSVDDGARFGLEAAAAALLGGRTLLSPLWGGLVVGLLQSLSVYWLGSGFFDVAPLALLVVLIGVRQRGPGVRRGAIRLPSP
jgi:branched-subunit amino acid ABC-type transport system permease component